MRGVGQLASHWNVPVFGWVSSDIDLRDKSIYSTLIRLLGPLNAFGELGNLLTILLSLLSTKISKIGK